MIQHRILILGASYGSLLAAKLLLAGHHATLVCLPEEVDLINREGFRVRMPVKGHEGLVEVDSRALRGRLKAAGPADVAPADYDLIVLAMQEPQYRGVRALMAAIAGSGVPCMSIMNMPPLPYVARLPGVDVAACRPCYADPTVWDPFEPALVTLCSPDPQAFRPPGEKVNVLQVRLPTNFKAATFPAGAHNAILRDLERDIEASRFETTTGMVELPVKLKVHDSVFVPLAKWSMLLAGNYRCVQPDAMRSIKEAVHTDIAATRAVYEWVAALCKALGARESDLVPFEKYANAARMLESPASAARALAAGAPNIERVDLLVQTIAAQRGMQSDAVDAAVALVESWLARNRAAAAARA